MADFDDLKSRAEEIRDETTIGANTAPRVGGLLVDMVEAMGEEPNDFNIVKNAVNTILYSLGNYCFPNGRPTIDWGGGGGGTAAVTKTIGTGLSSSGGDDPVDIGDPLEVEISIDDNLYIVDDDNVVVTMGGTPVVGAWDAATMKVTIAAVYDDVVIVVPSITYVADGLVFNLDGLNRGGTAGHWTDLVGNVDFALTDCTEDTDNVQFNGTSSKGVASGKVDVNYSVGTIETVADLSASSYPTAPTNVQPILTQPDSGLISIGFGKDSTLAHTLYCMMNVIPNTGYVYPANTGTIGKDDVVKAMSQLSFSNQQGYRNGTLLGVTDIEGAKIALAVDATSSLAIGNRHRTSTDDWMKGKIYCIRIYNKVLTSAERALNLKVDRKRFNLS